MTDTTEQQRPIMVVGVDGSEASIEALRWAADQAALTGTQLHVVAACDYRLSYGWSPETFTPSNPNVVHSKARLDLTRTVRKALGEHPRVKVVETVVDGPPKRVLVEHSTDAELLVVGCRGLGAFRGMLLGSVSSYVASHSHCPVVIVHHHEDTAAEVDQAT